MTAPVPIRLSHLGLHVRDPEGNRVEAFADTPRYSTRPRRTPIDLTRPEAEICEQTRALCEARPECRPFDAWKSDLAGKLAPEATRG